MCHTRFTALVLLLVAPVGAAADDANRPDPPEGFAWQEMEDISGAVLIPDGWHFDKSSTKGGLVYRVTKEKLDDQSKSFLTGLTINVVRNVKEKSNAPPSIYAIKYITDYMDKAEIIGEPKVSRAGPMQRITAYFYRKSPEIDDKTMFRIRVSTYANDETDTLYVVIFGTPKDEWEENYKIGKQLFNPLGLDPRT